RAPARRNQNRSNADSVRRSGEIPIRETNSATPRPRFYKWRDCGVGNQESVRQQRARQKSCVIPPRVAATLARRNDKAVAFVWQFGDSPRFCAAILLGETQRERQRHQLFAAGVQLLDRLIKIRPVQYFQY